MAFSTVAQQEKLKARTAAYWHRLATGQHLGFRKTKSGATWIARAYDSASRKQVKHALGDFGQLQPGERFDAASKAAQEWFKHMDAGGTNEVVTVADACERYAKALARKSEGKAKEARRRFAQYINSDAIACIKLPKLKRHHVADWRKRLADTPATFQRAGKRGVGRGKGKGTQTRPRAATTVDRDVACVRAALNFALAEGFVTSSLAWREELKSSGAHNRRTLYLDRAQRRALLDAVADDHLRNFISALASLPMRPGAVAALTVRDFDAKQSTLRIATDKAGAGRIILLPAQTAALVERAAKGKLPSAPLFARWDGKRWRADEWVKGVKAAASAAQLPESVIAYTLRHSGITDLVTAGLDLFTVAALAGTSVQMIEDHYGHLRADRARDALAGLVL